VNVLRDVVVELVACQYGLCYMELVGWSVGGVGGWLATYLIG